MPGEFPRIEIWMKSYNKRRLPYERNVPKQNNNHAQLSQSQNKKISL